MVQIKAIRTVVGNQPLVYGRHNFVTHVIVEKCQSFRIHIHKLALKLKETGLLLFSFRRLQLFSNVIDRVSLRYPNTEKRVENTMHSGIFLRQFEVLG